MKKFLSLFALALLIFSCNTPKPQVIEPAIVPQPQHMEVAMNKHFTLNSQPNLHTSSPKAQGALRFLSDFMKAANWECQETKRDMAEIRFEETDGLADEAYELSVNATGIHVRASHEKGFFYGVQSVIQLLPPGKQIATLPYMEIKDEPRFAWRGLHLDVGRHFFPVDFIKKYIGF